VRVALWCPSLGTACGISQYTTDLGAALPGAILTTEPPDPRDVDVVHIQHEPGIFPHEGLLSYAAQSLRAAGVKVVTTLHTVGPAPYHHEQYAHAYVSLARAGAETLRERHQDGRPVEWIDHVCPRWRDAVDAPTRVIGAHGFLWHDKGFFELVDALRGREDLTLLLYSHPRHPDIERQFAAHIAGTATIWHKGHLPLDEVIDGLAATADILVYWRRPGPWAFGSGSVRAGLASGVPVLTSRAPVFDDLGEAVYRPDDLLQGIDDLLTMPDLRRAKTALARRYVESRSPERHAEAHLALYRRLLGE
jgi:glycosyltransferase involved in cell wall biosynthesis